MINNSRSVGVIDPAKYTGNIHIIGVGATGSRIVRNLIELGFPGKQIHIHDFDIVEEHNINNQVFDLNHIGMPKVVAMSEIIKNGYAEVIHSHQDRVDQNTELDGVVFLLTDTMSSRKEIVTAMKINPNIKLVIETRLDPQCGYVHTFSPLNRKQYEFFIDSLFDDDAHPEVVSACGTRQTIGHVVDILAGTAMCEFVKFINEQKIGKQVFFAVNPYFFQESDM
jgi:molybdopterin/thiamine biosynthesis adenylyltransferase